jgi:hypothetical protein
MRDDHHFIAIIASCFLVILRLICRISYCNSRTVALLIATIYA